MMIYIIFLVVLLLILIYYFLNKNKNLVCLMYHNVFDKSIPGIIGIYEFEKHMKYIYDMKMKTFKMEELEKINYNLPKNSILVTFDDGYKNNYTNAFPILKKYSIKATIFLNTKYIESDEDYLNWKEISEMYESGLIDFQLHTHSHFPTIRKPEIKGFFEKKESNFVKREYFSIFKESLIQFEKKDEQNEKHISNRKNVEDFRDFDFTGFPVFKIRSRIAIKGYKLKEDFISEYKKVMEKTENLTNNERKKIFNNELKKNRDKYLKKVTDEEFNQIVQYEISENKKIIEKKLNKKAEYLAYPWGHKYMGDKKDIERLGVKGFVFTTGGINRKNLDYQKILRVNGDSIQDFESFEKKVKKFVNI